MPIASFQLPNGKIADFEVPAGLSQEEIEQAVAPELRRLVAPPPPPKQEESGFFRQTLDVPIGIAKGAASGVRALSDIFGANNPVSRAISGTEDYLDSLLSAQARNDQQEIAKIMKEAEDKGMGAQVAAGVKAFATAPVDFLSQALGSAVPIVAGGLAASVARLGAFGVGAVTTGLGAGTGAGIVKGSIYDAVKGALTEAGESPEVAEARAQAAQSYGGENWGQILTGTALGGLAGRTGVEKLLLDRFGKQEVAEQAAKGIGRRAAEGAVTEAVPEIAQAGQEQLAQNLALQRAGFDVPTLRGVAGAATLEGLAGGVLGGGLGAISRGAPPEAAPPAEPEAPPAPPVVTNYQTIDQTGNPATISVSQDNTGTIVATGPDGEPVDLSNMISAGFTVEDSIKSVFSAPEAPVVPAATPRVEPEITPPIPPVSEAAPQREVEPTFNEEAPFEGAEMRAVKQPPMPLPEEITALDKDAERVVKDIKRAERQRKGESLAGALRNKLNDSELYDIFGTEAPSYFKSGKKSGEGKTIADAIADGDIDAFIPDEFIVNSGDSPETVMDKQMATVDHIKDKLRNKNYLTASTESELRRLNFDLKGIEDSLALEMTDEQIRQEANALAAEIAAEQGLSPVEETFEEGPVRDTGERPATTGIKKSEPREELTLTGESNAEIAARLAREETDREAAERKAIADRERGLFTLTPQVSEAASAPTGDMFGARGLADQAPKRAAAPATETGLFETKVSFQKAPPKLTPPPGLILKKGRNEQVVLAARELAAGRITKEEYDRYVEYHMPVYKVDKPEAPLDAEGMRKVLRSNQVDKINEPIKDGAIVGLRMDINALNRGKSKGINGSVVTAHPSVPSKGKEPKVDINKTVGYYGAARIKNVRAEIGAEIESFEVAQNLDDKSPQQVLIGEWVNQDPKEIYSEVQRFLKDPSWTQVSLDPLRHSFFYDRSNMMPVASADEILQVGRFVLAKNVKYSDREKFLYSVAGKQVNIAEAQRVEKALKGKTPIQAAKWMANNATNPDLRLIGKRVSDRMQKLMDAGIKFDFHIVNVGSKAPIQLRTARGITTTKINLQDKKVASVDIWLNGTTVTDRIGTDEETVMHELVHAVTVGANHLGQFKSFAGTDAARLHRRLNDLRNAVVNHANERFMSMPSSELSAIEKRAFINRENVLDDTDEILAYGLTDPEMQEYLESIPYKGQTAWNAFVEAIREFLGLPKAKETALSEVLAIADELFALPVMEAGKKGAVKAAPPAKPIATQDQIDLFNASVRRLKTKPTPTAEGQAALDTINDLGRQVEETPTTRQKIREYWDNATDNPQATKEAAKKATVRFLDKIETVVFSSDAALNNATRRLINETTMSEQEKMGVLLSISSSQAVHPDALANLFIRYGGLNYDPSIYKYVAVDKKDNFVSLVEGIDTIGAKYGLTKEQAERVSHTAFEAKRLSSIARFNRALKVEIDDLRDMARTSSDPTARDLAAKEVRRKVKDFKFVHMTDEQIQRGLDLFKTIPELNALVDTWNGIRENSRKELVESGLWSEQEAEGLLSNMDYVPFYREDQLEKGKGPKEFLRNLQVQAKEKKLKGSDKPVADIFDNMARWTQYAVKRSVMNRLALAKIDAAVEMGIAKKVEKQTQGDNSVRVWRDGNAEYYSLDDPLFMDAFTGLESVAIPSLKYFAKLSNLLRQSVVLYPLFSISQVPQDAFAAMFSSGLKTRFALTIPARAVKEFIKTLFKRSQTHKELERIGVVGIRDFTAAIAREDAEIYAGLKARPGVLNKVKSVLEHIAMSSDNAVRQAVYEASIAQGVSRAEAIEKAFNLINFRNRGSSKGLAAAGQVIPFFNAYLAAQHVAYRTISGVGISPTNREAALKTLAATTASVMALSLIYAMLIGDDEDYLNKPSVMRDRLFMIPGTGLSIPIRSDIFSIPKIITEHMYMLMTDNGASDGRKFRDSMKAALGNALFSPTVVPQAIKPVFEVGINYNLFQGRPLVGTYQQGLETARQFNDSTSELAKLFGQTGLISPIAADHLIRGMLGSAGGLTLYMTNFALHNDPAVPRPALSFMEAVAALPGTSGFVSKEYETALKNDFYVLRDEVSTAVNTLNDLKKRSPNEIEEFLADETNLTRVGMAKAVNRITKNLTDIRRSISQITASDQMSASEKAEQIRELKAIEREILQNVDLKSLREMANL
jgi:hypothetical protein